MKIAKILTLMSLVTGSLMANDEKIISFYKEILQSPDVKIKILSKESLAEANFEKIVLELSFNGQTKQDVVFKQGEILVPDIVDLKTGKSLKGSFLQAQEDEKNKGFQQKALELLAKEDKKFIISIGDANKPAVYVFSDPECPYCRAHLDGIEEVLKTKRVLFVLTPVHQRSAFDKAVVIYKEMANTKTDKEKIEIMRKRYTPSTNTDYPKVSDEEYQELYNVFLKYVNAGLNGVPTVIEKP